LIDHSSPSVQRTSIGPQWSPREERTDIFHTGNGSGLEQRLTVWAYIRPERMPFAGALTLFHEMKPRHAHTVMARLPANSCQRGMGESAPGGTHRVYIELQVQVGSKKWKSTTENGRYRLNNIQAIEHSNGKY
jgi:hypothetical protein